MSPEEKGYKGRGRHLEESSGKHYIGKKAPITVIYP